MPVKRGRYCYYDTIFPPIKHHEYLRSYRKTSWYEDDNEWFSKNKSIIDHIILIVAPLKKAMSSKQLDSYIMFIEH